MSMIQNKKGFTLVETMVYVSIVSVFFLTIISFATTALQTANKARSYRDVQSNGRFAIERIAREVRSSNGVVLGSSTFGTNPGVLTLNTSSGTTVFDVSGGVLRIKEGVAPAVPITNNTVTVSNLVFENRSITGRTQNISITLTLDHINPNSVGFSATKTYTTSVVVRSKEN